MKARTLYAESSVISTNMRFIPSAHLGRQQAKSQLVGKGRTLEFVSVVLKTWNGGT
jgi:hypothetical protein